MSQIPPESGTQRMIFAQHRVVAGILDAPLIAMRRSRADETLRRLLVTAVAERDIEHGAHRFVQTVEPVTLGVHVPGLVRAHRFPRGKNGGEIVAQLGVATVCLQPSVASAAAVLISCSHIEKIMRGW